MKKRTQEPPKTSLRKVGTKGGKPVYQRVELVNINDLNQEQFFKKKQGTFVYKIIAPASVKFLKLDPEFIYGVCYNGNVTQVKKGTIVIKAHIGEMVANLKSQRVFEKSIGCKDVPNDF